MYRRNVFLTALLTAALLLPARAQQPPANAKQQQAPAPAQPPNQQAPEQSGQTFKREVNLVDVLFTVLNRRNKLVPDLDEKDFKVLDDGKPQEIRYFSKQTDLPLRIGMLLDTSNSIRDRIKFEQDASVNFLFSVLRRNKDEAFVMTFDDEPQIIQRMRMNRHRLLVFDPNRLDRGHGTILEVRNPFVKYFIPESRRAPMSRPPTLLRLYYNAAVASQYPSSPVRQGRGFEPRPPW